MDPPPTTTVRPAAAAATTTATAPALPKLELLPPGQRLFHARCAKKAETEQTQNEDVKEKQHHPAKRHTFIRPVKRIHEGPDVSHFLVSQGYRDIGLFILQLNHAMCPRTTAQPPALPTASTTTVFTLQTRRADPPSVVCLRELLDKVGRFMDEAPPDPGPRRFGNASFRVWHKLLAQRVDGLLAEYIRAVNERSEDRKENERSEDKRESERSEDKKESERSEDKKENERSEDKKESEDAQSERSEDRMEDESEREATAMDELKAYFLGGFGSAQRLDYGTGHELSFLAFLGCLWKLGAFAPPSPSDGHDNNDDDDDDEAIERSIVLGVLEPYLRVVRKLILTYTLEPAGSHGVWGLDDHSFLPYVFGSAQLSRPLVPSSTSGRGTRRTYQTTSTGTTHPQEGSAPRAPKPADILKPTTVEVQRELNLYFSAVGFIDDVKRGPFWEHSPILFDVSGIKEGWGKINKGMIKMYNAEVLSKFPVVQHFPFGSMFSWDVDPEAVAPVQTIHMANQPLAAGATTAALRGSGGTTTSVFGATGMPTTSFPSSTTTAVPTAYAPAGRPAGGGGAPACQPATAAPWAQATRMPPGSSGPGIPYSRVPPMAPTTAPVSHARTVRPGAPGAPPGFPGAAVRAPPSASSGAPPDGVTKAPWAK